MSKALVVDDSKTMRMILCKLLKDMGHTVIAEASNGLEAYEAYGTHRPDFVTMDITMGVMDGVQAVKKIIGDYPDARIVMVSAYGHTKMVMEAISSGAKHFLVKPIDPERAKETIEKVLADEEAAEDDIKVLESSPYTIEQSGSNYSIKLSEMITKEEVNELQRQVNQIVLTEGLKVVLRVPDNADYEGYVIDKLAATVKNLERSNARVSIHANDARLKRRLQSM